MFITALFTIAKTWNHPKCPSMVDWIKKMWHIYTVGYVDESVNLILSKLTPEQKTKLHVFTHKWELNNGNTWTQGGEHQTPGPVR